jgi:NADH-quinone oxidoreductase subunit N
MTSAIMLYGFSLLFGFTGTTNFLGLLEAVKIAALEPVVLVGSLLLILVGFSFKISAVPLHFWAPDVYEGAPTPIAGFLSTASKAAGFSVLVRVLLLVFPVVTLTSAYPEIRLNWQLLTAVLAVATMTIGNFIALAQKNIKRLLAYSSIAHAGYILVGVSTNSEFGLATVVLYLIVYLITNLAAFGIVGIARKSVGSDEIEAYAGLSRRSPGLALAMLVSFLSLTGMPPFAGFISKTLIFAAAVKADMVWLAFVGVLNAIVGVYYYLIVLKVVYLYRSDNDDQPIPVTRPQIIALTVLCFGILLLGVFFAPWFGISETAAAVLF